MLDKLASRVALVVAVALTIALVVGLPSVAAAAPVDTASQRVALRAYERYVAAVAAAVPAARSR
jgi:hypothetical protein